MADGSQNGKAARAIARLAASAGGRLDADALALIDLIAGGPARYAWVDNGPAGGGAAPGARNWHDTETNETRVQVQMPGAGQGSHPGDGEGGEGGAGAAGPKKKPAGGPGPAGGGPAGGRQAAGPIASALPTGAGVPDVKDEHVAAVAGSLARTPRREAAADLEALRIGEGGSGGSSEAVRNFIALASDDADLAGAEASAPDGGGAAGAAGQGPAARPSQPQATQTPAVTRTAPQAAAEPPAPAETPQAPQAETPATAQEGSQEDDATGGGGGEDATPEPPAPSEPAATPGPKAQAGGAGRPIKKLSADEAKRALDELSAAPNGPGSMARVYETLDAMSPHEVATLSGRMKLPQVPYGPKGEPPDADAFKANVERAMAARLGHRQGVGDTVAALGSARARAIANDHEGANLEFRRAVGRLTAKGLEEFAREMGRRGYAVPRTKDHDRLARGLLASFRHAVNTGAWPGEPEGDAAPGSGAGPLFEKAAPKAGGGQAEAPAAEAPGGRGGRAEAREATGRAPGATDPAHLDALPAGLRPGGVDVPEGGTPQGKVAALPGSMGLGETEAPAEGAAGGRTQAATEAPPAAGALPAEAPGAWTAGSAAQPPPPVVAGATTREAPAAAEAPARQPVAAPAPAEGVPAASVARAAGPETDAELHDRAARTYPEFARQVRAAAEGGESFAAFLSGRDGNLSPANVARWRRVYDEAASRASAGSQPAAATQLAPPPPGDAPDTQLAPLAAGAAGAAPKTRVIPDVILEPSGEARQPTQLLRGQTSPTRVIPEPGDLRPVAAAPLVAALSWMRQAGRTADQAAERLGVTDPREAAALGRVYAALSAGEAPADRDVADVTGAVNYARLAERHPPLAAAIEDAASRGLTAEEFLQGRQDDPLTRRLAADAYAVALSRLGRPAVPPPAGGGAAPAGAARDTAVTPAGPKTDLVSAPGARGAAGTQVVTAADPVRKVPPPPEPQAPAGRPGTPPPAPGPTPEPKSPEPATGPKAPEPKSPEPATGPKAPEPATGPKAPAAPGAAERPAFAHEEAARHYDAASAALERTKDLSPTKKAAYRKSLGEVLSRLTPAAAARLGGGSVMAVNFHKDSESLRSRLAAVLRGQGRAGLAEQIEGELTPGGCYLPSGGVGQLFLDGGGWTTQAEIYAHEYGHAIDGPAFELSGSPEWKAIWEAEIDREGDPLTAYARKHPMEGVAEFFRVVYAGAIDPPVVRASFPRAYAFFLGRGLVPDVPPAEGPLAARDIFDMKARVDFGDGGHLDALLAGAESYTAYLYKFVAKGNPAYLDRVRAHVLAGGDFDAFAERFRGAGPSLLKKHRLLYDEVKRQVGREGAAAASAADQTQQQPPPAADETPVPAPVAPAPAAGGDPGQAAGTSPAGEGGGVPPVVGGVPPVLPATPAGEVRSEEGRDEGGAGEHQGQEAGPGEAQGGEEAGQVTPPAGASPAPDPASAEAALASLADAYRLAQQSERKDTPESRARLAAARGLYEYARARMALADPGHSLSRLLDPARVRAAVASAAPETVRAYGEALGRAGRPAAPAPAAAPAETPAAAGAPAAPLPSPEPPAAPPANPTPAPPPAPDAHRRYAELGLDEIAASGGRAEVGGVRFESLGEGLWRLTPPSGRGKDVTRSQAAAALAALTRGAGGAEAQPAAPKPKPATKPKATPKPAPRGLRPDPEANRLADESGVGRAELRARAEEIFAVDAERRAVRERAARLAAAKYERTNGGRLTEDHSAFRGGDETHLRGFDRIASEVASEVPELGLDPWDATSQVYELLQDELSRPRGDAASASRRAWREALRDILDERQRREAEGGAASPAAGDDVVPFSRGN